MSTVRHFLRNTQTNDGTGGIIYDLSTVQGSIPGTLTNSSLSTTTFAEIFSWQITVDDNVNSTSFPTSISIGTLTTTQYRWRIQRVNSSNVVQVSSSYSSTLTTTGPQTETLTLSTTWNTGDRLRLSFEAARTGNHGVGSINININNADSFVDIPQNVGGRRRIFFIT
jgi:hypothetical protein